MRFTKELIFFERSRYTKFTLEVSVQKIRAPSYTQITGPYLWPHLARMIAHGFHKESPLFMFDPMLHNTEDSDWYSSVKTSQFQFDPLGNRPPRPSALMGVNRQVNTELLDIAHHHTTHHLQDRWMLACVLSECEFGRSVRRISLGFPNYMFFNLIILEQELHNGLKDSPTIPIKLLGDFPNLRELNLHFQVAPGKPPSTVAILDPWCNVSSLAWIHQKTSFQKIFVVWFLTLAFAHIRHIARISFSGHVNDSVRRKWEAIFQNEHNSVHYDMSLEIQRILSTPWQHLYVQRPPRCTCFYPCDWWNQHGPYNRGEVDPNFQTPKWPHPTTLKYDPRKHDRFRCGK